LLNPAWLVVSLNMLTKINSSRKDDNFPDVMLLCDRFGVPRAAPMLWQSISAPRFSNSYVRRYLLAFEALYLHHSSQDHESLDELFIRGRVDKIYIALRSYLAKLQNDSAIIKTDQSERWQMVVKFTTETLDEILHRGHDQLYRIDFNRAKADLRRIEGLYSYLKAPKNLSSRKARSIPSPVLDDLFEVISPDSVRNPFRGSKLKWRNFLIICLLLYQGLRAGELLGLPVNCVKHSYDPVTDKDIFWLNVKSSDILDTRSNKPKIKNTNSVRQIPIDPALAHQIQIYNQSFRGKSPHGFLFSSNQAKPLAKSSLGNILDRMSASLSQKSKVIVSNDSGKYKLTPHNFRHTCAVMRIQEFLSRGIEMGTAEELMRVFFGWSKTSQMPSYYSQAFYEGKLQDFIGIDFSHRLKTLGIVN